MFKTFCLVSSFIGHEQGKAIVKKYDNIVLFSLLFNCHYHLHSLLESKRNIVDQGAKKDKFEMTTNTSEPTI